MRENNRPIFILTTGRSGSTLLQKLLNCHPRLLIWGEHGGILNHLEQCWSHVASLPLIPDGYPKGLWMLQDERPVRAQKWTAWDNPFSKNGFEDRMKRFLDSLFAENVPHDTRWGFKEIQYHKISSIDFLKRYFPESNIIFLVRNPVDVCISIAAGRNLIKTDSEDGEKIEIIRNLANGRIANFFKFMNEAKLKYKGEFMTVTYEDLVLDVEHTLADIVNFLGMEYSFDEHSVDAIMNRDIVSVRSSTKDELRDEIRRISEPMLQRELAMHGAFLRPST